MTKVEAIENVIKENGGCASLQVIYDNIEKYYPTAKQSKKWDAGIRGVLYRELYHGNKFKKVGLSLYALNDYVEEEKPKKNDIRMHSYIEGLCAEIGNVKGYKTYTADPSAKYRDNVFLKDVVSLSELPKFTYDNILIDAKRIDVLWFKGDKHLFPKMAIEVVDSINTLHGAFERCSQLLEFQIDFRILAPEKHRTKFEKTLEKMDIQNFSTRFQFVNYETVIKSYEDFVENYDSHSWLI